MLSSGYVGAHLVTAPPASPDIACEVFASDLLGNIYLLSEQSCVLPRYTARESLKELALCLLASRLHPSLSLSVASNSQGLLYLGSG